MDGRDDLFMLDDPSAYGLDTVALGLGGDATLARAGGGLAVAEREGAGAVVRVEYKIEEAAFHCIAMAACDLFVRRGGDGCDTDVYFAPPGSDVYSIPSKLAPLPSQPVRCQVGRWTYIAGKILPHSTDPYKPSAKEIEEVTKVFFIRHMNDDPYGTREFMLDFEEVYVFDGHDKTLRRATVILDVPEDQPRDRRNETLIVRDDGNTFRIIPKVRVGHVSKQGLGTVSKDGMWRGVELAGLHIGVAPQCDSSVALLFPSSPIRPSHRAQSPSVH
ncbi:unnamed protein product [Closterium sp. Naga37s-1]|nr:unnamed protein product [Closterium sp. Naga37s-1]